MSDVELLRRRFERERAARKEAETLLEKKSLELFQANTHLRGLADQLRAQGEQTQAIVETAAEGIVCYDSDGMVTGFNLAATRIFGSSKDAAIGTDVRRLFGPNVTTEFLFPGCAADSHENEQAGANAGLASVETEGLRAGQQPFACDVSVSRVGGECMVFTALVRDLTQRKSLEARLGQAQKMESIGQLAAGIAHEVNTPIQFVGDNIQFLESAFEDMGRLLDLYDQLALAVSRNLPTDGLLAEISTEAEVVDFPFLREEFPSAIRQSLTGIERIATVVRAMKEFSQPATEAKSAIDFNQAIQNVLTVTHSKYEEVAEIEAELAESLPMVVCLAGQINQVISNILANAAEAIAGNQGAQAGLIRVSTQLKEDAVELRIQDNGPGVPVELRHRIFDPFFTTKEVGQGMGQGLAFVYDMVVNKHDGSIFVQSPPEGGAAFVVRLPVGKVAFTEGRDYANTTH